MLLGSSHAVPEPGDNSPVSSQHVVNTEGESGSGKEQTTQSADDLKRTQDILMQQEKLASIGQLAAGVAHEINNPISYIQSNLNSLDRYVATIKQLLELLFALRTAESAAKREDLWRRIDEFRTTSDLGFILQEITALTGESLHGVERVRQIVSDLKSFSRSDDTKVLEVDIRKCMESALNIVWNEVKYHAKVFREFEDVPPLECHPQQLTQVFINLVINAAQAISGTGEIRVRIFPDVERGRAVVTVTDTGAGIAPDHLKRIFDPFFTTKEVGKGTGLGLSIAYGIVHRHGGTISVRSTLGTGTEFRVELPYKSAET